MVIKFLLRECNQFIYCHNFLWLFLLLLYFMRLARKIVAQTFDYSGGEEKSLKSF